MKGASTSNPKRPQTTEGTAARTRISGSISRASGARRELGQEDRREQRERQADQDRSACRQECPVDRGPGMERAVRRCRADVRWWRSPARGRGRGGAGCRSRRGRSPLNGGPCAPERRTRRRSQGAATEAGAAAVNASCAARSTRRPRPAPAGRAGPWAPACRQQRRSGSAYTDHRRCTAQAWRGPTGCSRRPARWAPVRHEIEIVQVGVPAGDGVAERRRDAGHRDALDRALGGREVRERDAADPALVPSDATRVMPWDAVRGAFAANS